MVAGKGCGQNAEGEMRAAGKSSLDAGKSSRCSRAAAHGSMPHRILLQCMQTRLHPCDGHGPAPASRPAVPRVCVDRRAGEHDHGNDEAQAKAAGVVVVLLEPQLCQEKTSSRCTRVLAGSEAQER